jgi:hypothetical protein
LFNELDWDITKLGQLREVKKLAIDGVLGFVGPQTLPTLHRMLLLFPNLESLLVEWPFISPGAKVRTELRCKKNLQDAVAFHEEKGIMPPKVPAVTVVRYGEVHRLPWHENEGPIEVEGLKIRSRNK